jgi:hypothetical protein
MTRRPRGWLGCAGRGGFQGFVPWHAVLCLRRGSALRTPLGGFISAPLTNPAGVRCGLPSFGHYLSIIIYRLSNIIYPLQGAHRSRPPHPGTQRDICGAAKYDRSDHSELRRPIQPLVYPHGPARPFFRGEPTHSKRTVAANDSDLVPFPTDSAQPFRSLLAFRTGSRVV